MNDEYSKEVIRVERWEGGIVAGWTLVGGQVVCGLAVCRYTSGNNEATIQANSYHHLPTNETSLDPSGGTCAAILRVAVHHALWWYVGPTWHNIVGRRRLRQMSTVVYVSFDV